MTTMTFEETTARITEVVRAQNELLDYTGHVVRGLSRDRAAELIKTINAGRERLGWKPLDLYGRYRRNVR